MSEGVQWNALHRIHRAMSSAHMGTHSVSLTIFCLILFISPSKTLFFGDREQNPTTAPRPVEVVRPVRPTVDYKILEGEFDQRQRVIKKQLIAVKYSVTTPVSTTTRKLRLRGWTTTTTTTSTVRPTTTPLVLDPPHIPLQPSADRRRHTYPESAFEECLQPRDKWNSHDKRPCAEGKTKWYFDTKTGLCRFFNYKGCGRSSNRFSTRRECEAYCVEAKKNPCDPDVVSCYPDYAPTCFTDEYKTCLRDLKLEYPRADRWELEEKTRRRCPPKFARCKSELFKFVKLNLSPTFVNTHTPAVCSQPKNQGTCLVNGRQLGLGGLQFYYDPIYQSCRVFYYSGCAGNDNRFDSFSKCMDYCGI